MHRHDALVRAMQAMRLPTMHSEVARAPVGADELDASQRDAVPPQNDGVGGNHLQVDAVLARVLCQVLVLARQLEVGRLEGREDRAVVLEARHGQELGLADLLQLVAPRLRSGTV